MILSVALKDFEPHYIIINEKTKNNIMDQSDFHRLIYSDEFVSINGIYLIFTLENVNIEKYFNKIKCNFETNQTNNKVISNIKSIEKMILNKYRNTDNKTLACRIQEQLENNYIKLYGSENINYGKNKEIHFYLKISGIWVSNGTNEYGLTFRFFIFNNQF